MTAADPTPPMSAERRIDLADIVRIWTDGPPTNDHGAGDEAKRWATMLAEALAEIDRANAEAARLAVENERLRSQLDDLARFVTEEVPNEPSQSEGVVPTVMRLLRERNVMLSIAGVYQPAALPADLRCFVVGAGSETWCTTHDQRPTDCAALPADPEVPGPEGGEKLLNLVGYTLHPPADRQPEPEPLDRCPTCRAVSHSGWANRCADAWHSTAAPPAVSPQAAPEVEP